MRRFLPFAALLGVALVLGCQDVGTGPDGLVPQFDKKGTGACAMGQPIHCHGDEEPTTDPTYTVTHSGSDFTTVDPITAGPGVGKRGTSISFGTVHAFETIVLTYEFVSQLEKFGNIEKCFGIVEEETETGAFDLLGSLRLGKGNVVTGLYFFLAKGTDGETKVGYELELTGTPSAAFAPDGGQTTIVTWTAGLLHAGGDVPACVGGGGMHSDQEKVTISGTVTITGN